jgi:hypothetical protein
MGCWLANHPHLHAWPQAPEASAQHRPKVPAGRDPAGIQNVTQEAALLGYGSPILGALELHWTCGEPNADCPVPGSLDRRLYSLGDGQVMADSGYPLT